MLLGKLVLVGGQVLLCARMPSFLQFVHLHPVDFHFHGQFLRFGASDPGTLNLHVDEQIEGGAEGVLSRFVRFDARIGEVAVTVDGEYQRVGEDFHGVGVESVAVDGVRASVGRIVLEVEVVGVVGVDGLVGDGFVVEMFHDVDFASHRPLRSEGQHPDGGPSPLCSPQAGAYFNFAVADVAFATGVKAAGDVSCRVACFGAVHHTAQHQTAVANGVEGVDGGHMAVPVGLSSWNLLPGSGVNPAAAEMVLPDEFVARFIFSRCRETAEEGDEKGKKV